jgi:PhnB protein
VPRIRITIALKIKINFQSTYMARTSIYLNFQGNAEEAFNLYRSVFQTEWSAPIMRMGDLPAQEGMPALSEQEKQCVMHVALPILGGVNIMGTDMLESMGHRIQVGNNTTISLEPDTKEEADRMYKALSEGGSDGVAPHDEFWGYWGVCLDRFGIRWMFNVPNSTYANP